LAQLGYGDQDEVTVVPFFTDVSGRKNITTCFRHAFVVTNVAAFSNLTLRVLRDDGAVVYLNGRLFYRLYAATTAHSANDWTPCSPRMKN
jgi:hypothetical protein